MSDPTGTDRSRDRLRLRAILPRNLTARAAYAVAGNPVNTRPESGVDNTHPGLEFDIRMLDRGFLPGLKFDYHYRAGARLTGIDHDLLDGNPGLTEADLAADTYLWFVHGRFGDRPDEAVTAAMRETDGYLVLRRIMDLEPGPLTVVVGPAGDQSDTEARAARLKSALEAGMEISPALERSPDGRLLYAVLEGDRAAYLTEDGVVDPAAFPPGELSQTLCSPWQWDFADCHCYYWASAKPDIVLGEKGTVQNLNFQRDRAVPTPPEPATTPGEWQRHDIDQIRMIAEWETLPLVISDRETTKAGVPSWPYEDKPLTLDEVVAELRRLATVEHALCVEYLFAYYSVDAPKEAGILVRGRRKRYRKAAREVFWVAVDEMRHLRWVNEALSYLGEPPVLDRATTISSELGQSFELRPLDKTALDDFIAVEAPSAEFHETGELPDDPTQLDGMYIRILLSLHQGVEGLTPDETRRLIQLVKAIVDEGVNHWHRFSRTKGFLGDDPQDRYLRPLRLPGAGEDPSPPQDAADAYYDLLLRALYLTFRLGHDSRGHWLRISHRAMFALDDLAHHMAKQGFGVPFKKPDWLADNVPSGMPGDFLSALDAGDVASLPSDQIADTVAAMFQPVEDELSSLSATGQSGFKALVERHRADPAKMKAEIITALSSS